MKLALAVKDALSLFGGSVRLRLDRTAAVAVAAEGGREVLLYVPAAFGDVEVVGVGKPMTLSFDVEGDGVGCLIGEARAFERPVVHRLGGADLPDSILEVEDEQFSAILGAGGGPALAEPDAAYAPPPDLGVRVAVYRQVLARWDNRCAITGARFPGADGLHGELLVVPIRPLAMGGPLHVRNCLPMVDAAAKAWDRGHISVTRNLEIIMVERHVDVDLLERMRPSRLLLVPDDPALGPDLEHLAYHRAHVFGARPGQLPSRE